MVVPSKSTLIQESFVFGYQLMLVFSNSCDVILLFGIGFVSVFGVFLFKTLFYKVLCATCKYIRNSTFLLSQEE
jgi:hypothetical protein